MRESNWHSKTHNNRQRLCTCCISRPIETIPMTKIPETAYEKHKARRYQEIKERNSHWKEIKHNVLKDY